MPFAVNTRSHNRMAQDWHPGNVSAPTLFLFSLRPRREGFCSGCEF